MGSQQSDQRLTCTPRSGLSAQLLLGQVLPAAGACLSSRMYRFGRKAQKQPGHLHRQGPFGHRSLARASTVVLLWRISMQTGFHSSRELILDEVHEGSCDPATSHVYELRNTNSDPQNALLSRVTCAWRPDWPLWMMRLPIPPPSLVFFRMYFFRAGVILAWAESFLRWSVLANRFLPTIASV